MNKHNTSETIHQFSIDSINGSQIHFSDFAGKQILLVNVASECGLTPQYQQLQDLFEHFRDSVQIIACPSNDFGQQEPGNAQQILQFCELNYGVQFPITSKIIVQGPQMHELYKFVTQKALNGFADSEVSWNFQKYIFDEAGHLRHIFSPQTEPLDDKILDALSIEL